MDKIWFWIAVLAYCAAVIGIGFWIQRRNKKLGSSQIEFWIAQRQLPAWWLAASLTAGWLMLGWIGFGMSQVYMYGATGLWILPIPWFILCIIIILIVPFYRKINAISLPQMLEKRFGISARVLVAIFSFFVFIIWVEAETFMAGTLLSPFLGIDPKWCMVLTIVPIIIYTYLGGFRAVVMTDVLQFGFMAVFMIILAIVSINSAAAISGGQIIQSIAKITPPWVSSGQTFNPFVLGFFFPVILFIGYIPGWLIEQDLSIRMQATKTLKDARKAAWLGFLLIGVFVIILPTIVAFCSLVVFPPTAGADGALVANPAIGSSALGIISAFIAKLPVAVAALMVIGIIASQMSTLDTFANVSALPIAHDIVDPILKKLKKSDKFRFETARVISVVVLVIGLGLAFLSENLNDVYYISSGILSASIAVQVFFMFWKRTTLPAVISSAVIGFVGTVFGYFYEYGKLAFMGLNGDLPEFLKPSMGYNYIAFGVILAVITIIVVSLLTKKDPPEKIAFAVSKPEDDYDKFVLEAQN